MAGQSGYIQYRVPATTTSTTAVAGVKREAPQTTSASSDTTPSKKAKVEPAAEVKRKDILSSGNFIVLRFSA